MPQVKTQIWIENEQWLLKHYTEGPMIMEFDEFPIRGKLMKQKI